MLRRALRIRKRTKSRETEVALVTFWLESTRRFYTRGNQTKAPISERRETGNGRLSIRAISLIEDASPCARPRGREPKVLVCRVSRIIGNRKLGLVPSPPREAAGPKARRCANEEKRALRALDSSGRRAL